MTYHHDFAKTIIFISLKADEEPQVCFQVKTVTKIWAQEITWTIGINGTESKEVSCGYYDRAYDDNQEYEQDCCLPKHTDDYTITCEDSYGDGGHGGYLEINSDKYCEDFLSGTKMGDILPNIWSNQTGMILSLV